MDRVDRAEALQKLVSFCSDDSPHLVVTADASMLVMAQQDTELRNILNTADLVVPDSIGVVWAARLLGTPLFERVAGVELVERLCGACASNGYSVFLLGASPGVAARAGDRLQERFPGLKVAGSHHGYFQETEEAEVIRNIMYARPGVLLVAMGIPRQEKWLYRHLNSLPIRVGMGVGGSLDVLAGEVRRAPMVFQRTHLEWLYRIVSNPRRYRKAMTLPVFVGLTVQDWITRKIRGMG